MTTTTRFHRVARTLVAVAGAFALASCSGVAEPGQATNTQTPGPSPTPSQEATPDLPPDGPDARKPTTGLAAPWSVAFVGNTPLVSERDSARILELAEDGSSRELAKLIDVVHGGEGGLLGLAVLEAEDTTWLYAYSTGTAGNRIQRFTLTGEPGSFALGAPETILDYLPSAMSHNGGRIGFGPDGMLYATVGDAANPANSQDLESLGGKILRMTPEGKVPSDNPFDGSLVYTYGHRNPQGIAWDDSGAMYASEFGQDTWDELNVIEAGKNYGWPVVEGIAGDARFVDPVQQWAPADASPSGIAIADGSIHIANLRGQRLRSVPLDDLGASTERFVEEYGRLRDVVVTPNGTLWMLSNNTDGRIDPRAGDDRFIDTGIVQAE